jgi:hypothetical protein
MCHKSSSFKQGCTIPMRRSPWRLTLVPSIFSIIAAASRTLHTEMLGQDSSVGTATRYRPDFPGFECRWGQDFPHSSTATPGPARSLIRWVTGYSFGGGGGGKAAGAWR